MNSGCSRSALTGLTAALAATALMIACGVNQPTPLPQGMALDIFPVIEVFEVDSGKNYNIAGHVTDSEGDTLSGIKVYFSVQPDTMGNISPPPSTYTYTDPTSENGFRDDVVFVGRRLGTAVVWGKVRNDEGGTITRDSISVLVRPPINQ